MASGCPLTRIPTAPAPPDLAPLSRTLSTAESGAPNFPHENTEAENEAMYGSTPSSPVSARSSSRGFGPVDTGSGSSDGSGFLSPTVSRDFGGESGSSGGNGGFLSPTVSRDFGSGIGGGSEYYAGGGPAMGGVAGKRKSYSSIGSGLNELAIDEVVEEEEQEHDEDERRDSVADGALSQDKDKDKEGYELGKRNPLRKKILGERGHGPVVRGGAGGGALGGRGRGLVAD